MTRRGNSRLAGITFLLYIVTGIGTMILMGKVNAGASDPAARLAAIVQHELVHRVNVLLTLLQAAYAVILGVTLYALTRDEDRELALFGFCARFTEGLIAVVSAVNGFALIRLATAKEPAPSLTGIEAFLKATDGSTPVFAALCFAIGSTLFCYLFLRARTIPVPLAWLGVVASVILVAGLPLQILDVIKGGMLIWMPMLVFEVWFAFFLIFKGVVPAAPARA